MKGDTKRIIKGVVYMCGVGCCGCFVQAEAGWWTSFLVGYLVFKDYFDGEARRGLKDYIDECYEDILWRFGR